jgi:Uma2 family endonuclease
VAASCSDKDTAPGTPKDYLAAPVLLVEVLSPPTETTDRREKMRAYALLDSLREYVLVDSRRRQVEIYRKQPDGGWEQWIWNEGETARLDSVGLDMALDELYEDVDLEGV